MQRNVSANHDGVMQHFLAKRPSSGFSLEVLSVDSSVAIRMLTSKYIFENYKRTTENSNRHFLNGYEGVDL